jgi:hypothetical protein
MHKLGPRAANYYSRIGLHELYLRLELSRQTLVVGMLPGNEGGR